MTLQITQKTKNSTWVKCKITQDLQVSLMNTTAMNPWWTSKHQGCQNSGGAWKSRWPSWAPVPNKPSFCGCKATPTNQHQVVFVRSGPCRGFICNHPWLAGLKTVVLKGGVGVRGGGRMGAGGGRELRGCCHWGFQLVSQPTSQPVPHQATLGQLLNEGVERIWAFISMNRTPWNELNSMQFQNVTNFLWPSPWPPPLSCFPMVPVFLSQKQNFAAKIQMTRRVWILLLFLFCLQDCINTQVWMQIKACAWACVPW